MLLLLRALLGRPHNLICYFPGAISAYTKPGVIIFYNYCNPCKINNFPFENVCLKSLLYSMLPLCKSFKRHQLIKILYNESKSNEPCYLQDAPTQINIIASSNLTCYNTLKKMKIQLKQFCIFFISRLHLRTKMTLLYVKLKSCSLQLSHFKNVCRAFNPCKRDRTDE